MLIIDYVLQMLEVHRKQAAKIHAFYLNTRCRRRSDAKLGKYMYWVVTNKTLLSERTSFLLAIYHKCGKHTKNGMQICVLSTLTYVVDIVATPNLAHMCIEYVQIKSYYVKQSGFYRLYTTNVESTLKTPCRNTCFPP